MQVGPMSGIQSYVTLTQLGLAERQWLRQHGV